MREPFYPTPVTHNLLYRIAKHDPDILDRVMTIHAKIPFGSADEIESPVSRHRVEHMIKDW